MNRTESHFIRSGTEEDQPEEFDLAILGGGTGPGGPRVGL